MFNFTPLAVAVMGIILLNERPGLRQIAGILIFICGILLYFSPFNNIQNERLGIIVMSFGVAANALSAVIGRRINMKREIDPVVVTFVSMLIGGTVLLAAGLARDGIPELSPANILSLIWLAVVNTALAFTLWNYSLRTLTAIESSIINGTMLIQIAVLSVIFLDTDLSSRKVISLFIVAAGAILVQIKRS